MSVSLACKYRPKSFEECVGQPVVVSVLCRQIATKTFKSRIQNKHKITYNWKNNQQQIFKRILFNPLFFIFCHTL